MVKHCEGRKTLRFYEAGEGNRKKGRVGVITENDLGELVRHIRWRVFGSFKTD